MGIKLVNVVVSLIPTGVGALGLGVHTLPLRLHRNSSYALVNRQLCQQAKELLPQARRLQSDIAKESSGKLELRF